MGTTPPTLDPHQTGDVTSSRYILEVFGGLLTIDPNLAIAPDLAKDWTIDPDGMGYIFSLNPDAKFHDGRKVTAADFKWSIERAADPATEAPAADVFLGDIVGVAENSTAKPIRYPASTWWMKPQFDWIWMPLNPTSWPSSLTPRPSWWTGTTWRPDGDWIESPNGTGPFMLAEYSPGELMRFERFEDYHLGPAYLDSVEFTSPVATGC